MFKKGCIVTIKKLPAGRGVPEKVIGARGVIEDVKRYGSTNCYDIKLQKPIRGLDTIKLMREYCLELEEDNTHETNKDNREQEIVRQQIYDLKDELKAWPLPNVPKGMKSEIYNRVWQRRISLHKAIAEKIQQVEGKL